MKSIFLFLLMLTFSSGLYGFEFQVNTKKDLNDSNPGDERCHTTEGTCSLRAAVTEANVLPGIDTIIVPGGTYLLTGEEGEDNNLEGDMDITDDLLVQGKTARETILNANQVDRFFHLQNGAELTIRDVTIKGGKINYGHGGGIWNQGGELILERCTVSDNILELQNQEPVVGAGVAAEYGELYIFNSGIYNNVAPYGGGIHGVEIYLEIKNTTVSSNLAFGGAGIRMFLVEPNSKIMHSTIAFNEAISGQSGGIRGPNIIFENSLVASNTSTDDDDQYWTYDCFGPLLLEGYNLIGYDCSFDAITSTDWVGTNEAPFEAKLGPLQNNGGPTDTHAPLPGSPAIGTGGDCGEAGQRGFFRNNIPCNRGAFQYGCGDGELHGDEVCDDGNRINGDDCDNNCTLPACGNGEQAPGEECDDGNTIEGDGCDAQCLIEIEEEGPVTTSSESPSGGGGCKIVVGSNNGVAAAACFIFLVLIYLVRVKYESF